MELVSTIKQAIWPEPEFREMCTLEVTAYDPTEGRIEFEVDGTVTLDSLMRLSRSLGTNNIHFWPYQDLSSETPVTCICCYGLWTIN